MQEESHLIVHKVLNRMNWNYENNQSVEAFDWSSPLGETSDREYYVPQNIQGVSSVMMDCPSFLRRLSLRPHVYPVGKRWYAQEIVR